MKKDSTRFVFSDKQVKKIKKQTGITVQEIDIEFNDKKSKIIIPRMYRNGKRIHRKSFLKVKNLNKKTRKNLKKIF